MSKFEYGWSDDNTYAVSKERFSKQEALEMFKEELNYIKEPYYVQIEDAYIRHRAGVTDKNEPRVGWWIEYTNHKRNCPVWLFRKVIKENVKRNTNYEYIYVNLDN